LLNENNTSIKNLRVFPSIRMPGHVTQVSEENQWLQKGLLVEPLSDLLDVIYQVRQRHTP
jgi:hypothetical protein